MKDWLAATAFLLAINLVAIAIFIGAFAVVRAFGLTPELERSIVGWSAIGSLIVAVLAGRSVLRRIERRAR